MHAGDRIEVDRAGFDEPQPVGRVDSARGSEKERRGQIADARGADPADGPFEQPVADEADPAEHARTPAGDRRFAARKVRLAPRPAR